MGPSSFQCLLAVSHDPLAVLSGDGTVLNSNLGWKTLTSSADLPEHPLWAGYFSALPDPPPAEDHFQLQLANSPHALQVTLTRIGADHTSDQPYWLAHLNARRTPDQTHQNSFFNLIEHFPFAVGLHRHGRFTYVNEAASNYLGYTSPDQLLGTPVTEIIHPSDIPQVNERLRHLARYGQPLPERPTKLIHRDGQTLLSEVSAFAFHDDDGEFSHVVVARDVTEKRLVEEKLRESQRLQAIGRVAGGIAHDFNNILAIITAYADLLLSSNPNPESRQSIREILHASQRAALLIRQLLTFSRGDTTIAEDLNLNDQVRKVLPFLRHCAGTKLSVRTEYELHMPKVHIAPSHVEQILVNLILNARDATEGQGQVTIRTSLCHFENPDSDSCRSRAQSLGIKAGNHVVLEVSDDGSGMQPHQVRRAMEPFFTTKPRGQGLGLGLSSVYGLVRQTGGACDIESAPGEGTTVRVYLPITGDVHQPLPTTPDKILPLSGRVILLVDDDHAVRMMVARILKRHGCIVHQARDAEHALEVYRAITQSSPHQLPDILVTDVVMPRMNGPELSKRLRQQQGALPTLFMSGYANDDLSVHTLDGQSAFIQKPFSTKDFLRQLSATLDLNGAHKPDKD